MWQKKLEQVHELDDAKNGTGYAVLFRFEGVELRAHVRITGGELESNAADIFQPAELDTLRGLLEQARDHTAAALDYQKI